jgi:predicted RNase H-like HicB family nuclease
MLLEEGAAMECTAVIRRDGEWWIGWIAEVPGVNGQERTIEELRVSLAEALSEALEFNRREAFAAAGDDYLEEKLAVA